MQFGGLQGLPKNQLYYNLQDPDYVYVDGNGVDYLGSKDMDDDEDQPKVDFTFTPLEYDNYDVDQVI